MKSILTFQEIFAGSNFLFQHPIRHEFLIHTFHDDPQFQGIKEEDVAFFGCSSKDNIAIVRMVKTLYFFIAVLNVKIEKI
ncbi:hypothetical protein M9Y82_05360 [Leptospira weilii]|uniref:Uncharacterized protein n=2 Tax=Leptospira weilii TaxID=28184 RepID=M6Q3G3_9LEPT|nr:hypothetical protein [Leptospira weilii]EMM72107.1 hypothetical protein LEP1GSC038_3639 [Leptospira weilii str. 2006001855]EMN90101.1 hypothetical protein LEP1GSC108_4834 [Leptospira weilii str. UI 13098]MCL8266085.1 hypothetical protein [Leptospira weilii]OMI18721.1 hypothetical protein BUQ74_03720 [Leptospira weilii serovar Heyan]QDK27990.1 hypothetical protein FHG68_15945 [Leptospira weilii]